MERFQIGIIGAGRIGRVHAENIAKFVPQMEIKTVADPYMSPEAEEFLRGLRIPNLSRDAEDILQDPEIRAGVEEVTDKLREKLLLCRRVAAERSSFVITQADVVLHMEKPEEDAT